LLAAGALENNQLYSVFDSTDVGT